MYMCVCVSVCVCVYRHIEINHHLIGLNQIFDGHSPSLHQIFSYSEQVRCRHLTDNLSKGNISFIQSAWSKNE